MRSGKIIAILMAALLCVTAFVSCDKGEDEKEKPAVYYNIAFETAGGGKIDPRTVKEGTTLTEPPEPLRDGYVFDGWYNGTKHWDFTYTVKEDMTLTAHWVAADNVFTHSPAVDGETTVITGIKDGKKRENIKLPTYIGGYRVTAVGEGAFSKLSSEEVKSITVPAGVTSIGNNAFEEAVNIEIIIEGEISHVGEKAFFGCTGLKSIKFGEVIETIAPEAFAGSGLGMVILPRSVKVVDENAFFECESLKILILHDSVESVKDMAFENSALESVLFYGTGETFKILLETKMSSKNGKILDADKYIYSEAKPTEAVPEGCSGFWHFNGKGEPKAW